jgi:hypothetical protein
MSFVKGETSAAEEESLAGLYAAERADEPARPLASARDVVLLTTR